MPANIRFPEYFNATSKNKSIVNNGNGMFTVTDPVDNIVFNISGK
jgi:hypothetical protein